MRPYRVIAALVLAGALAGFAPKAGGAVLVTVDKAAQRMSVVVDGELRWTWPVSTGRADYDTPTGRFATFRMAKEHYSREWDDAPMPHSIFFTRVGHAIHGTSQIGRLGQPASHGCIRLAPENAAQLFALVRAQGLANTQVVIAGALPPALPLIARRRRPTIPAPMPRARPREQTILADAISPAAVAVVAPRTPTEEVITAVRLAEVPTLRTILAPIPKGPPQRLAAGPDPVPPVAPANAEPAPANDEPVLQTSADERVTPIRTALLSAQPMIQTPMPRLRPPRTDTTADAVPTALAVAAPARLAPAEEINASGRMPVVAAAASAIQEPSPQALPQKFAAGTYFVPPVTAPLAEPAQEVRAGDVADSADTGRTADDAAIRTPVPRARPRQFAAGTDTVSSKERARASDGRRLTLRRRGLPASEVYYDPRVEVIEETYVNGTWVRRRYYRQARPADFYWRR